MASGAPSAKASPSLPPTDDGWVPKGTEARVTELQQALRGGDALRFAQGLRYPVRVNTNSWCEVAFKDAPQLAPHFEQVVTPKVRAAILDAAPPFGANIHGVMFGRGEVWLTHDNDVINTDSWDIPGMPCTNWKLEPMPAWLSGTFVYSSLAEDQGTIDPDPPSRWFSATLTIDLPGKATHGGLEQTQSWECRPLRFGYELELPTERSLGAFENGFGSNVGHAYFFDVGCPAPNGRVGIGRFELISRSLLAYQANDGFLIFLARVRPHRAITHEVAADQPCGGAEQCRPGLVCVARQESQPPHEGTCQPISALGWCGSTLEKSSAGRAFCDATATTP